MGSVDGDLRDACTVAGGNFVANIRIRAH
jgi:hypothetical protein